MSPLCLVHLTSRPVLDHWELLGCSGAHLGLRIDFEARFDPQLVGFYEKPQIQLAGFTMSVPALIYLAFGRVADALCNRVDDPKHSRLHQNVPRWLANPAGLCEEKIPGR